jgi:hypothetical protein
MANIRDLKKDVDFQVYELISDCFTWKALHGEGKKNEEVDSILEDAIALRNDLIQRINNPLDTENKKELKAHYTLVSADLMTGVEKLFERLSSVTAKKKK